MSVYTIVNESEIENFLKRYSIGTLVNYEGVGEGIENTNYFVDTASGRFVLTLFEQMAHDELPYFLDLMAFYSEHALPVPHPVADNNNHYLQELCGKPATLITRLAGCTVQTSTEHHCHSLGETMAKMHNVPNTLHRKRNNMRDFDWCLSCSEKILPLLTNKDAALLKDELSYQQTIPMKNLPQGVIHADLFRDNALFDNNQLTGLIDFYYACDGAFIYDLAVAVNDWCVEDNGDVNVRKHHAITVAYHRIRPLQKKEINHWQDVLRRAALRFWLSRLQDKHFPRAGAITHVKDPDVFKNILLRRKQQVPALC